MEHIEGSRGKKLAGTLEHRQKTVYDGRVFVGREAVELGLADEVGVWSDVLSRERPQAQVCLERESARTRLLRELI